MSCPDPSSIEAFALGRTSAAFSRDAMEAHLDTCPDCGEVVAELARIYANSIELSSAGGSLAYARTVAAPSDQASGDAASIAIGQTLGRYRLLRAIGEGGMGSVFAAYDPALDREVAVKVLHADLSTDPAERRARLAKEARAMAKLAHPNVVTVFDVGVVSAPGRQGIVDEASGQLFVAMELVVGTTLSAWLRAAPRTEREIIDAFLAAGEGLAAAHASGLVHRDVKPENILRSVEGRIRVTDFGLARASGVALPNKNPSDGSMTHASVETAAGAIVGTPAYMSPEQFLGEPADAASDQFSFAVSLFEALHGRRPFPGRTVGELRDSVLRGGVLLAGLPPWQREFFGRSLARVPASRFPDMRAALSVLGGQRARSPWRAVAGVAAVLGAVGLAFVGARGLIGSDSSAATSVDATGADARDSGTHARSRPTDPEVATEVDAIRAAFGSIEEALRSFTPDLGPTTARAEQLVKRARGTEDDAVLAEALLLLGRVRREAERPKLAAEALDEATRVARGAHEDALVYEAAILLIEVQGLELGKTSEAEPWVALAEAEEKRQRSVSRGARLHGAIGRLRLRQGRPRDAVIHLDAALRIAEDAPGPGFFDGKSAWTRVRAELLRDRARARLAGGQVRLGLADAQRALELVEGDVILRGVESVTCLLAVADLAIAARELDVASEHLERAKQRLAPFGRTGTVGVLVADTEALLFAAKKDEAAAREASERALMGMLRGTSSGALEARDTSGSSRSSGAIDFAQRVKSKVEKPEDAVAIADANDKAAARAVEGDEAAAATQLAEALTRAEGSSVTVGGATGAIRFNLALLALRKGDLAAARDHVGASLIALQREVGEDHVRVGTALALEAHILEKLGGGDAPARAAAAAAMLAKRGVR